MIAQTVEYALRAVIHLAYRAPGAQTTEQLATATLVPKAYLSKVLQGLVAQGIVSSRRGVGGGMTLAKLPEELSILDIVNAVDPLQRIHTCPLGFTEHGSKLCPLHQRLDNALAQVEEAFGSTNLAEVLADLEGSVPLCEVRETLTKLDPH
ncbi:MAG: Rrf2 family transcriptional regulator [Pirellulales bacterium]|jgi:Rrf2 family protein|nr:Rrf2 family transcriptional regulator [Pirellulales bacterium]HJN66994.1 Rrf2 family transcriptional regulator [Pirellulales bacterium]|tara:strand:- start:76 stop:528 length:453 start_codon:yes stop_codon:yes gene_type:complete